MTTIFINPGDEVGCEVDDLLKLLCFEFFAGFETGEKVRKP